ncbi:MAG TPA: AAA domain-containing protein [Frankiaceae bacterium]|nr:AAA domain-containing protein [Frankiaceae bacterium]
MVEDALREMAEALRAEVETLRADRTIQGRPVTGGARVGTSGKWTTYAFPDVPGAGLPDDTPVRLILDGGDEVDGEVAARNGAELVLALHEDVGSMVEHALLIADASFLLERLAMRLDEVLDGDAGLDLDLVAKVLDGATIKAGRTPVEVSGLNAEQADAVALALGSDAAFVWGPPGTGKTTTIAHVVAEHAKTGRSVLLVANTNTAVDTALSRVDALLGKDLDGRVLRHGTVVREEVAHLAFEAVAARVNAPLLRERATLAARLDATDEEAAGQGTLGADHDLGEERSRIRDRIDALDRSLESKAAGVVDHALVVATTVYQTWLGGLPERPWDVVVVDEASMLMLPMTAYAAGLASESVVVAGDFRQLPPIVSSTQPGVTRWLATDAFTEVGLPALLAEGSPPEWLAALRTQYRMRPEIAALVSDLFYDDNRLATGRDPHPTTPGLLAGGAPLVWVDTSDHGAWAGVAGGRGSRFNPVHAVLVAAVVDALPEGVAGVVTPYAAHERLVAALLTDRHGPHARAWVSTVHRFQGNEQDVVVVDLADAYGASPGPASRAQGRDDPQARLLNVAVSRARDQLVVLGDASFLAARSPRGTAAALLRDLRENGTHLDPREVMRGAFSLEPAEALVRDVERARDEVAFFTPRVTGHGMAAWSAALRGALERGVAVRVVTRPPTEQPAATNVVEQMRVAGVEVDLWAGMEERLAVVDGDVAWLGGTDLGLPTDATYLRLRGTALPTALTDLLRPARAPKRALGEPTNEPCEHCGGMTVLRRGGGAAAFVCLLGRRCPGLREIADDERGERPDNATGPCRQPGCAGWLVRRSGRYGEFVSCSRYPACSGR